MPSASTFSLYLTISLLIWQEIKQLVFRKLSFHGHPSFLNMSRASVFIEIGNYIWKWAKVFCHYFHFLQFLVFVHSSHQSLRDAKTFILQENITDSQPLGEVPFWILGSETRYLGLFLWFSSVLPVSNCLKLHYDRFLSFFRFHYD
jgi:hypothetical protein